MYGPMAFIVGTVPIAIGMGLMDSPSYKPKIYYKEKRCEIGYKDTNDINTARFVLVIAGMRKLI